MSDVTVAPAGGAPAAAPANEVVINPSPVDAPSPVGSQAPDKPVGEFEGSKHRPESRREAIKAAFDRATKQQDAGTQRAPQRRETAPQREARPADARPGHNQPPEETARDQQRAREPAGRQSANERQQHREQGRFARAPDPQQPGQQQSPSQQQRQAPPQLPHGAPFREPPSRFRDQAKAEWHAAPESVRGEFTRMAQEFNAGFNRYKESFEAMRPIRRFHDMAQQQGTTLEKALTNYVGMEQKLREDVVGGLDVIVRNLNLTTPDGQQLGLRDVAYHILNMSPDQHRLTQAQNQQHAAQHQIGALHQEIAGLKSYLQQMHTQQQFTQTRGAVDQFANQHPRFDELGDLIENEIKLGFTLDQAYRRAELLRPATHAVQTRTPSAQTRQVDRSISGAPSGGPSNGSASGKRAGPPPNRRDAIQNAIRRVNGGV